MRSGVYHNETSPHTYQDVYYQKRKQEIIADKNVEKRKLLCTVYENRTATAAMEMTSRNDLPRDLGIPFLDMSTKETKSLP